MNAEHLDVIREALTEYEFARRAFYDGAPEALADADRARAALQALAQTAQTLAELQQDYDALASSHFMLRLARDELLRREYLAMPAQQPDRND